MRTSVLKPAPRVPKLEAPGGQGADNVGQHEAGGEQRQRDQRYRTQAASGLCGKLRVDRKGGQHRLARSGSQRVMLEAAEGADELPQKRRIVDAADHEQEQTNSTMSMGW